MLRRCGVVGHPVQHSLSPVMHRAAYAALGLDWTYEAVDVAPGGLTEHIGSLDSAWRGLSVTAPHKRDALALADTADDVACAVGGANTLVLGERVAAHNTDVPGAVAALRERGVDVPDSVRIVGGGATAAAIAAAVAGMGATTVELVVRDEARAAEAAAVATAAGLEVSLAALGEVDRPDVDLFVSTVPSDAVAQEAEALVGAAGAVFDVVYDPWPTPLAEVARRLGRPLATGLDLLAHQAVAQVGLMCGDTVTAGTLRDVAMAELRARGRTP